MFALLTDYFLLHRKISIPAIGRFEISQEPAKLVFAEKQIHPPVYSIVFTQGDSIDPELVNYICTRQHLDRRTAEDRLGQMGKRLKEHISRQSVTWTGFGVLSGNRHEVFFQSALEYPIPLPVPAEKIVRENVAHTVLIGDKEFQKRVEVVEEKKRSRFPAYMVVSTVLLVLAIGFIIWHLYSNHWKLSASASCFSGF